MPRGRAPLFTVAVLPDTQVYAKHHPSILRTQLAWLARSVDTLGLAFVAHVGDVVDDNSDAQWQVASSAFEALDGLVPYAIAPGNHDYGEGGSGSVRESGLSTYFPPARFSQSLLGTFEEGRSENTAHRFETSEGPWLAFALELAPRPEVVLWARGVLAESPDAKAIVATHAYLYSDGTLYDGARTDQRWAPRRYRLSEDGGLDGQGLFDALIAPHPQIACVVCGHVLTETGALRSGARPGPAPLHEMLANYQTRAYGGEGYLRLLEVHPEKIEVRTYSPWREQELGGPHHRFRLAR
jgi:hypothetical protein